MSTEPPAQGPLPGLPHHGGSFEEIAELEQAIDTNDIARVKALMKRNPALHAAPLGYGKDGPLTWVAECRVPWEPPSPVRLAMAEWMLTNGSDVHQGGDGPLMRAALNGYRIPMMELLVSHGADATLYGTDISPSSLPRASRWIRPLYNGCSITARIRTVATHGRARPAILFRARLSTISSPRTRVPRGG